MKELQLRVLTQEEISYRYDNELKGTKIALCTKGEIKNGYSIGVLEYDGLAEDSASNMLYYAEQAVSKNFKGYSYKIGKFTDLTEVHGFDRLYFSFKVKKENQIDHYTGCDSQGFIYNL